MPYGNPSMAPGSWFPPRKQQSFGGGGGYGGGGYTPQEVYGRGYPQRQRQPYEGTNYGPGQYEEDPWTGQKTYGGGGGYGQGGVVQRKPPWMLGGQAQQGAGLPTMGGMSGGLPRGQVGAGGGMGQSQGGQPQSFMDWLNQYQEEDQMWNALTGGDPAKKQAIMDKYRHEQAMKKWTLIPDDPLARHTRGGTRTPPGGWGGGW